MQPTINNQQLQQQEIQAKGDLRLLEKKRQDALNALERINKTKAKEFETYSAEIARLREERSGLASEVERVKKELYTLQEAIVAAKSNLKYFNDSEIAQINRDISEKLAKIEQKTEFLSKKEEAMLESQRVLELVEVQLAEDGKTLKDLAQEMDLRKRDLDELEKHLEIRARKSTSDLFEAKRALESLHSQVRELDAKKTQLLIENKVLTDDSAQKIQEQKEILSELSVREKKVEAATQYNREWEERLKIIEVNLKDELARKEKYGG